MTNHNQRNTATELIPAVGARVLVRFEDLRIRCTVIDAKNSWGKVRLLVTPYEGYGAKWIELGHLVAEPERLMADLEVR
jgi:hypothetical protein